MGQNGLTTSTKPPRLSSHEQNPDPIRDEKDLAEFSKLLSQEKMKIVAKKKGK